MKKLALVGYGKMGKLMDRLAPEHGFEVVLRLRSTDKIDAGAFANVDAAIEFSNPEAAVPNLLSLASLNVSTVVGTTGWLARLPEVTAAFAKSQAGLVWSPNFSVGVAIFRRLVEAAAKSLREQPQYGAWAWEIHHGAKKDAPSGTLLHLVEAMRRNGYDRAIDVGGNRAGAHPGTHEIGFDSGADTITLRHAARNREGFAEGALKSASWIAGKRGVFTFEDVLFGGEGDRQY